MRRAAALLLLANVLALPQLGEAKPRFFVYLRAVKEQVNTRCKLASQARALVKKLLAKDPTITLDLGAPMPKSKKALAKLLAAKKLRGYGIVFRITRCKHSLNPPAKGRRAKVLMVEVGSALDAETIPSGQLALAGIGAGQVGTEVSRIRKEELASLRADALEVAAKQSVARFITNLGSRRSHPPSKRRRRR
ncbi:MAG: hypothetical protein CSA24_01370 [Deltaproteobacteria bacterium]|nr:MAG: hypothetical protein CSB49_06925 [Pseudomonadota bacterium]PIE65952.1 MAG: hypothetical protein CSA24_01370 [Deltaproteobacteria bacterium]